jgi:hypothetical protein
MPRLLFGLALALAPATAASQINPALIKGTWEQVSSRDLTTGVTEDIARSRHVWLHFTDQIASQIWMAADRPVVQPAELARMSPDDRRRANYAKIWDDQGRPRFSGLAGFYHLDGPRMYFTLVLNLEPASVNASGMDSIVQLDGRSFAYLTGRTPAGGWAREQRYRRVDGHARGPVAGSPGRTAFDPRDLLGTWQSVETRNLKTGDVQRSAGRTAWFRLSDTTWTYYTMDKDRAVVTAEQLAAMSPDERMAANYAKVWNERGGNRFWGSAGTYRVRGDTITFVRRVISQEPWMVRVNEASEIIVRLDREMYITRSVPDADGESQEFVSRRVD